MEIDIKRKLVFGTTALAAVAFGGGAYAASQIAGANSRQAFLNDVAKRLKVTPSNLNNALKGAFDDQLQAAVKAGKLTQAQADQIKQHVQQTGELPLGGGFAGPDGFGMGHPGRGGFGFGGGGFGGGGFGGGGFGFGGALGVAAKYLGVTPAELRDQLVAGKSLGQIATAKHKPVAGLKDAITAEVRSRLGQAVAAKRLTSAQEQQMISRLSAHLDALINHAGLGPRLGGRKFFDHAGRLGVPPPGAPRQGGPPPGTPPFGAPPHGPSPNYPPPPAGAP